MPKQRTRLIATQGRNAINLACLEWFNAPASVISEHVLNSDGDAYSQSGLTSLRERDEYKEMKESLKETWQKQLLRNVSYSEIRKSATSILETSLKRLMEVVANPKTPAKLILDICMDMAKINGLIMASECDGDKPGTPAQESIAKELVTALQRMKDDTSKPPPETVQ